MSHIDEQKIHDLNLMALALQKEMREFLAEFKIKTSSIYQGVEILRMEMLSIIRKQEN